MHVGIYTICNGTTNTGIFLANERADSSRGQKESHRKREMKFSQETRAVLDPLKNSAKSFNVRSVEKSVFV